MGQNLSTSVKKKAVAEKQYLGVMMLFVIYQAAVGDTSLPLEGLMVPVGSSCKNGSLADLANHQDLYHIQHDFMTVVAIITMSQLLYLLHAGHNDDHMHVQSSQVSNMKCGRHSH